MLRSIMETPTRRRSPPPPPPAVGPPIALRPLPSSVRPPSLPPLPVFAKASAKAYLDRNSTRWAPCGSLLTDRARLSDVRATRRPVPRRAGAPRRGTSHGDRASADECQSRPDREQGEVLPAVGDPLVTRLALARGLSVAGPRIAVAILPARAAMPIARPCTKSMERASSLVSPSWREDHDVKSM